MQDLGVENERLTKDVRNSNSDNGEGTKQVRVHCRCDKWSSYPVAI